MADEQLTLPNDQKAYGYTQLEANGAARQPATWGEIWDANWKRGGLDTLSGLGKIQQDEHNRLRDSIQTQLGTTPIEDYARLQGIRLAAPSFDKRVKALNDLADTLDPERQKPIAEFRDVRQRAAKVAAKIDDDATEIDRSTYGVSGWVVGGLAGMAAQAADPYSIATSTLGGFGAGRGILRQTLGGVVGNVLPTLGAEPSVVEARERLGLETSVARSLTNIGTAAVVGGAIGGAPPAVGAGLRAAGVPPLRLSQRIATFAARLRDDPNLAAKTPYDADTVDAVATATRRDEVTGPAPGKNPIEHEAMVGGAKEAANTRGSLHDDGTVVVDTDKPTQQTVQTIDRAPAQAGKPPKLSPEDEAAVAANAGTPKAAAALAEARARRLAAEAAPSRVDANYIDRLSSGEAELPTIEQLDRDIKTARTIERGGVDEKTARRIEQLNRRVDAGDDAAIRELQELRKKLPDEGEPNSPGVDNLRQLRKEFAALERQAGDEDPAKFADGIARVLKRYIADYIDRKPLARAVFRKAFEQARQAGIDTRKLGNDVIDRFLRDLSPGDAQFMREEFAKFTGEKPAAAAPAALPPGVDSGVPDFIAENRREAIRAYAGTAKEKQVLDMARQGKTARQISEATGLDQDTVRILRDNAGIAPAGPMMTMGGATLPEGAAAAAAPAEPPTLMRPREEYTKLDPEISSAEYGARLTEMQDFKPVPVKKLKKATKADPEKVAAQKEAIKEWEDEYKKVSDNQQKALEREQAAAQKLQEQQAKLTVMDPVQEQQIRSTIEERGDMTFYADDTGKPTTLSQALKDAENDGVALSQLRGCIEGNK